MVIGTGVNRVVEVVGAVGGPVAAAVVSVVTLLLAVFSVGIGAGSLACERLSGHKVEIGLVPFGAIGMTLLALDLVEVVPMRDEKRLRQQAKTVGPLERRRRPGDVVRRDVPQEAHAGAASRDRGARAAAHLRAVHELEHWPGEGDEMPRFGSLDYWTWFPGVGFGDVKLLASQGALLGTSRVLAAFVFPTVHGPLLLLVKSCQIEAKPATRISQRDDLGGFRGRLASRSDDVVWGHVFTESQLASECVDLTAPRGKCSTLCL